MTVVDLDTCLRLVADEHRRDLIEHLRHETSEQTTIDELVTQLQQRQPISNHERSSSRERLVIQLFHTHLPKLSDHDVIEYDSETGTVRYQPHEQIEAILDSLPEEVSHTNPRYGSS
jgi:hypothetical protein